MSIDPGLLIAARTVWAEARGEGLSGMIAVAWTIKNRVDADLLRDGKPDWWGEGYQGVCLKPFQFSCWLESDPNLPKLKAVALENDELLMLAYGIIQAVENRLVADPTIGATHYYAQSMKTPPKWAASFIPTKKIGGHRFYRDPSAFIPGSFA